MKLTENRLRAIIKEELKGVLSEADVVDFESYLNKQREKEAIKYIGSERHVKDLAQALVMANNRLHFSHFGNDKEPLQAIEHIKNEAEVSGILSRVMARVGEIMTLQQGKREPSPYDYER